MRNLRLPLVLFGVLLLQTSILSALRVDGVHADALLLLAVAAGLAAGAETGAAIGFLTGVVADLFVQTPFGLSALTFAFVGFGTGALRSALLRSAWWVTPVTALLASGGGVVAFAVLGAVVGQDHLVTPRLVPIVIVVGVGNAVLSIGIVPLMTWAVGRSERAFAR